jgi:hypothetical protein
VTREEFDRLGKEKPPPSGSAPDPEKTRLDNIYGAWTAQLHAWCDRYLEAQVDCEFFPDKYEFRLYEGPARPGDIYAFSTVPRIEHSGRTEVVDLPRPENHPSQAELDGTFRALCLAAARILSASSKRFRQKHALPPPPMDALPPPQEP